MPFPCWSRRKAFSWNHTHCEYDSIPKALYHIGFDFATHFLKKGDIMKNPNGYGTVAKLSGNRRRPFIVKKKRLALKKTASRFMTLSVIPPPARKVTFYWHSTTAILGTLTEQKLPCKIYLNSGKRKKHPNWDNQTDPLCAALLNILNRF